MDQYFNQMEKIVKERKTSSRIRFMLQDVIDLRLVSRKVISLPSILFKALGWGGCSGTDMCRNEMLLLQDSQTWIDKSAHRRAVCNNRGMCVCLLCVSSLYSIKPRGSFEVSHSESKLWLILFSFRMLNNREASSSKWVCLTSLSLKFLVSKMGMMSLQMCSKDQ